MPLSSPSGSLARVTQLPSFDTQIDAELKSLSDVVKVNQNIANQQARLAARAGGLGGRTANSGAITYELDPSTPTGLREIWVPGKTDKERARNKELLALAGVNKTFMSDPKIQEKLAGIEGKSIDAQAKTLEDIRQNDLPRLFDGTPQSRKYVSEIMKPYVDRVRAGRNAIEDEGTLSTMWDSLRIGTKKAITGLQEIGADEQYKRQLNAQMQAEIDNIVEQNPYLREQRLREQEGQDFWDRSDGVGGLVQNALNWAGEDPTALATLGASAALAPFTGGGSLVANVARYAVPAVVGGTIGAGTEGSEFVNRTLSDDALTEEQQSQALREGFNTAAATGAVFGGASIPVTRVAGAAANAIARSPVGSVGRRVANAATKEEAEAIVERAALDRAANRAREGWLRRTGRSMAENATEAGLINVGDVVAQNVNYNTATGQSNDILEGTADAGAASLALAVPFGLLGGIRRRQRNDQPAGTPDASAGQAAPAEQAAQPADTPNAPAGQAAQPAGALSVAPLMPDGSINMGSNAGRYFFTVPRVMKSGGKWDPNAVVSSFLKMPGNDLNTLRAWLGEAPSKSGFYNEKRMVSLYNAAAEADPDGAVFSHYANPFTYDKRAFINNLRQVNDGDAAGFAAVVDHVLDRGVDPLLLRTDVNNMRLKATKKSDTLRAIDNYIERRNAGAANVEPNRNGTSGNGAATPLVGSNGQAGTRAVDLSNPQGNSGVEAGARGAAQAAPNAGVAEPLGNGGAVEGGRTGGTPEPNVGQGEALDANAASPGAVAGVEPDGGRRVATAAPRVPEPDTGAGSNSSADVGDAGGAQRAEGPRDAQSVSRADVMRMVERAPRVAQLFNQIRTDMPKEAAQLAKFVRSGIEPGNKDWNTLVTRLSTQYNQTPDAWTNVVDRMHNEYRVAQQLGVKDTISTLAKANENMADTIDKVYRNIWCVTR